jgi:hypothetical protein
MKHFSAASLTVAIAVGAVCAYLLHQLKLERARTEAYLARLHDMEAERADDKLAAQRPSPSTPGDVVQGTPGQAPSGVQTRPEGGPAQQSANIEQRRRSVLIRYGDFIEQSKLSEGQTEAFVRLMSELTERTQNPPGPFASEAAARKAFEAMQSEMDSRVRAQLGEADYAAYQTYQKSLPWRDEVLVLNMMVTSIGSPLDRGQKDQLLAVMLQEEARMPTRWDESPTDAASIDWRVAYDERLRGPFSRILNPAQLRQFDSSRALRLGMQHALQEQ